MIFQASNIPNVEAQSPAEVFIGAMFSFSSLCNTLASTYPNDPDLVKAAMAAEQAAYAMVEAFSIHQNFECFDFVFSILNFQSRTWLQ